MRGASTLEQVRVAGSGSAGYAADRLLRLYATLLRQRAAMQLLHGPALEQAHRLLSRAIFTLYLDCREAGVGEEARRLLAEFAGTQRLPPTPAGGGAAEPQVSGMR